MPLEGEALDSPVVIWIFFSKIAELLTSRDRKDRDSSNGSYLYRARNSVERFFNKIKQWRRVATRYDKLAAN